MLPRLHRARQPQVRDGETRQSRLRLRAAASRAFVSDFAARSGGCAGKGRDCRGVIVRLHLAQEMNVLLVRAILARLRIDEEPAAACSDEHGSVVLVGRQDAFAVELVGILDHLEQRAVARLSIDLPGRVENFVPAMLRICLGKHHQLDVVRVATEAGERFDEIIDLIVGQRQAEGAIRLYQRCTALSEEGNRSQRPRRVLSEEDIGAFKVVEHHLRHPVVHFRGNGRPLVLRKARAGVDGIYDCALDSLHFRETADMRDIGRLGGPRRNRSGPWSNHLHQACDPRRRPAGTVRQNLFQYVLLG